jgi:hypothetical protein
MELGSAIEGYVWRMLWRSSVYLATENDHGVMSCSSVALSSPYTSETPPPTILAQAASSDRSQQRMEEEEGSRNAGTESSRVICFPFNLLDQWSGAVVGKTDGAALPIYRGDPGAYGRGGWPAWQGRVRRVV